MEVSISAAILIMIIKEKARKVSLCPELIPLAVHAWRAYYIPNYRNRGKDGTGRGTGTDTYVHSASVVYGTGQLLSHGPGDWGEWLSPILGSRSAQADSGIQNAPAGGPLADNR